MFICRGKLLQIFQPFQVAIRDVMPEATVTAFECEFLSENRFVGEIPDMFKSLLHFQKSKKILDSVKALHCEDISVQKECSFS